LSVERSTQCPIDRPISFFRSSCLTRGDAPEAPSGRLPRLGSQVLTKTSCSARLHCAQWSCLVLSDSPRRHNGSGRNWPVINALSGSNPHWRTAVIVDVMWGYRKVVARGWINLGGKRPSWRVTPRWPSSPTCPRRAQHGAPVAQRWASWGPFRRLLPAWRRWQGTARRNRPAARASSCSWLPRSYGMVVLGPE
jgi:hypothetical protein